MIIPTWEKIAEEVEAEEMLVLVGNGNCEEQRKKRKLELSSAHKDWQARGGSNDSMRDKQRALFSPPDNPGCQVSGTLMVNRVPGNFHIEAKSINHNINSAMANLTHRVNHLSFGEQGNKQSRVVKRVLKQVPEALQQFAPIDNTMYATSKFHQAYHHYIKVVSTHFKIGVSDVPTLYQNLEQSQIVYITMKIMFQKLGSRMI